MLKPMNISQNWTLPIRLLSILPVIFGHQKYRPANISNSTVPAST